MNLRESFKKASLPTVTLLGFVCFFYGIQFLTRFKNETLLVSVICGLPLLFVWLFFYSDISTPKATKDKALKLFMIFSVFYFGILEFTFEYMGTADIGSFFSKNNINGQYYVNIFPFKDSQKNYRVTADVEKHENNFFIKKIHWNNGQIATFNDVNNYADYTLELNKKVNVQDDNEKDWYIELTNQKAKLKASKSKSVFSSELPEGFVLDDPHKLPEGFVLEE